MNSPQLPDNAPAALEADRAIHRARTLSRYLERQLVADATLLNGIDLREPVLVAALPAENHATQADLKRALRCLRRQAMARLIVRDLAGWANLAEVTAATTALAEISIRYALDWLNHNLGQTFGTPLGETSNTPQQLMVIGMGKLGGGELNVSSDIDLIFVYPEEGETTGPRKLSNHEYFTRLARALIGVLSELTEDGYVFRVDMRLRPYGDSGPLATSLTMLENYLVTQGREWERYAWIKSRVLTGNRGAELMELVRPFVFRRHLDYSAFASMRDLHTQIRREVERREIAANIKLGPGGIREIEFIAQVFQLIRGGRDAALRRQPTLEVLALLCERNLLPASAVEELTQAYIFLRNLEHRLQYLDDAQTHTIPDNTDDQALIAQGMDYTDCAAFSAALGHHRQRVSRHFNEIFAAAPAEQHPLAGLWQDSSDANGGVEKLAELGFKQPSELCERLAHIRNSARYRQMPASSQARLDRLAPLAIETAAAGLDADATLARLLQFLEAVSRRESYLALLEEYPQARDRLADFMRSSPWVADYLTQHPILLDELLDARSLYTAPDWSALSGALRTALDDADGDAEKQMDILRHFKHAQSLRLVAQDLAGTLELETLSDHLSDLACVVLREVLRLAWQGVRQRHREDPTFAIIGYGKLGGKELGYASDLDLVFLYDDTATEAPENYARLAQRIITWLTSATAAGTLYDTDLRLRPDGAGGLMVSSLASFREYQMQHAWVWEHQALTRARAVAGDTAIANSFEALRTELLRKPRELAALRGEIVAMRKKMHDAHPNTSGLFDIKHDAGGIIDVEFIVQYLVLGYAHKHAALTGNIGNLALLKLSGELGLIPTVLAETVRDAYREYRRLQHALRLQGERYARVRRTPQAIDVVAVRKLWQHVFGNAA